MKTVGQRIAAFVANLKLSDVPPVVLEKAKVTLLHDVGVGLAGYQLADPALSLAKEIGGCSEETGARLLIDGTSVTVDMATLATGAIMHARTQDDTQLSVLTHLGSTTLPALLALSDRDAASGEDFLTAMIAGYEAASAIAEGLAQLSTARGFRSTSIYGPLSAAAARASRLLCLSAEETTSALGLAASFGGGTNQTWVAGTQEWQYQVGMASRSGLIAALLAQRGVSGSPEAFEGVAGHYFAFAGVTESGSSIGKTLGEEWQIRHVTYKPYPICAINQVPVTVMVELARKHGLKEEKVAEVFASLAPSDAAYPGTDVHGPFVGVGGALMSAPYCLAVAIRKGGVVVNDLHQFNDESLMNLVRRIKIVPDESLPVNSCRITVRDFDGQEVTGEHISTPGTFNWDRDETAQRLGSLVEEMPLSEVQLDKFIEIALDLENYGARDLVSSTIP